MRGYGVQCILSEGRSFLFLQGVREGGANQREVVVVIVEGWKRS